MGRPIIQISLKDFETRKNEIAAELWRAATEIGFFYLKDHGLTEVRSCLVALIAQLLFHASVNLCLMHSQFFTHKRILQAEMQHMLNLSEQFFKLPAEQKANFKFDLVSY
jgi:isopenicillin N synthase-like dioxygenase